MRPGAVSADWRGAVSIMMPTPVPMRAPDTGWPVATPTPVPISPPAMVAHPDMAVTATKTASNLIRRIIVASSANAVARSHSNNGARVYADSQRMNLN